MTAEGPDNVSGWTAGHDSAEQAESGTAQSHNAEPEPDRSQEVPVTRQGSKWTDLLKLVCTNPVWLLMCTAGLALAIFSAAGGDLSSIFGRTKCGEALRLIDCGDGTCNTAYARNLQGFLDDFCAEVSQLYSWQQPGGCWWSCYSDTVALYNIDLVNVNNQQFSGTKTTNTHKNVRTSQNIAGLRIVQDNFLMDRIAIPEIPLTNWQDRNSRVRFSIWSVDTENGNVSFTTVLTGEADYESSWFQ